MQRRDSNGHPWLQQPRHVRWAIGLIGLGLSLSPAAAMAQVGAVKVECFSEAISCSDVHLGDICDSYSVGSRPVALSCDETADPGAGTPRRCRSSGPERRCTPFGDLLRSDSLGAYCRDSRGNDAVVICERLARSAAPEKEAELEETE